MKTLFILSLCLFSFLKVSAYNNPLNKKYGDTLPKVYLGIGTGVNSCTGMIGAGLDIKLVDRLFVRIGVGIGSWGYKLSGGIKHERKHKNGWTFSAMYSLNTGLKNFKFQFETISGQALVTKEVTLDLLQATTVSLSFGYNWFFKKKNKFYLEFGYAAPMESKPYKVTDGSVLSDNSKNILTRLQPGGVVIGLGFMFGL